VFTAVDQVTNQTIAFGKIPLKTLLHSNIYHALRVLIREKHHINNQMAIFGDFFASRICSEPHAAHFRPAF